MNKIIVYEHPDFKGSSKEFQSDVISLSNENFDNCISGVKVIGNPWVAYEHPNYEGSQWVFEEGEYANVPRHDCISSLKLVTEDLTNPKITLYEHPNYQGRSAVLTCESNLTYGTFGDLTSSHKVQKGAWALYEHPNRDGAYFIARAGQDVPRYISFDNQVSHARPLLPGRPSIKTEVLWDKKVEQVNSCAIDSICGINYGSSKQSFTTEMSREYEGSVTESFGFSNSTEIGVGVSFSINIGVVSAENNLSINNAFTVEKGSSNTRTERKSVKISLPANIPPRSKLTVNVIRKEVDVKVPVKLSITTGLTTKIEYGEYRCESGKNISAEFKEDKV